MTRTSFPRRTLAVLALALVATGCASVDPQTKLTRELLGLPKEDAYAKGDALLAKKKWDLGRQYLRFVAENYANDPIGKQAALRLADSYFDEKTPLGFVEAQARYKDFRNRYPSHPRADYALFRLALVSDRQAERPDRDQSNTRLATSSYRELIQGYPDSPYVPEARARYRAMRDLLADHEYAVANYYFRRKAFGSAKGRLDTLLAAFPEYARLDRALWLAGMTERRLGRGEDARLLWERLVRDFPASPLLKKVPSEVRTAVVAVPSPSS